MEASLLYKSVYNNYPGSLQGMEAPLRIANHFREKGEDAAAAGAYDRAIEYYRKLVSYRYAMSTQIMAAEYYVRAYAEQEKWVEAAELLLNLIDQYPDYQKFMAN